jgi:hypothetical protein
MGGILGAVRRRTVILAAAVVAGCGGAGDPAPGPVPALVPIGVGPGYRPRAVGEAVRARAPVDGLPCRARGGRRVGAHVELFARRRSLLIPAGVGIAPPHRRAGRYVTGPCSYAVRTREGTGVVELAPAGRALRIGDLFAVWGQPLGPRRLAGFRGPVRAWVDGRRWRRAASAIVLRRHAQVVLEVRGYVRPHARYTFPPGL